MFMMASRDIDSLPSAEDVAKQPQGFKHVLCMREK